MDCFGGAALMNKIERVRAALGGREVDRPPFSFWYHFGLQHLPGPSHARAEIEFYRAYDLDFLKVMNDYPYPLPEGIEALGSEDDWKRVEPVPGNSSAWAEQLSALSIINDEIGSEAFFIETIFSPWTTARRLSRSGGLNAAIAHFPQTVLAAMDRIAQSLADYAKEAIGRGAAGVFLSLGAASHDVMTPSDYDLWCRPFDLKILEAVKDAPFNVLHIHGANVHFDSLSDYPVAAVNWSHLTTPPNLLQGRRQFGKPVFGGLDETAITRLSIPEIRQQISESIDSLAAEKGLIVTPGCSVPTDTPVRNLKAIQEAVCIQPQLNNKRIVL